MKLHHYRLIEEYRQVQMAQMGKGETQHGSTTERQRTLRPLVGVLSDNSARPPALRRYW
jgi:hypothetical protein